MAPMMAGLQLQPADLLGMCSAQPWLYGSLPIVGAPAGAVAPNSSMLASMFHAAPGGAPPPSLLVAQQQQLQQQRLHMQAHPVQPVATLDSRQREGQASMVLSFHDGKPVLTQASGGPRTATDKEQTFEMADDLHSFAAIWQEYEQHIWPLEKHQPKGKRPTSAAAQQVEAKDYNADEHGQLNHEWRRKNRSMSKKYSKRALAYSAVRAICKARPGLSGAAAAAALDTRMAALKLNSTEHFTDIVLRPALGKGQSKQQQDGAAEQQQEGATSQPNRRAAAKHAARCAVEADPESAPEQRLLVALAAAAMALGLSSELASAPW
jgi:hypothetical protein